MDKIKVVVLAPNEVARVEMIDNTLESLQAIVEGPIECIGQGDFDIIVNEEGKIFDLEENFALFGGADYVAGTAIFAGFEYETGEFASLTDGQIKHITGVFKGREKYYRDR